MSMDSSVVLLRDKNNPEYKKKLKVLMACKEAKISPPDEIDEYFGWEGRDCDPEYPLEIVFEPREYYEDMEGGFEIDIDELPEGVKTIRFVNSY